METTQTKRKRRIGILGGTYDPPTIGHIQMAAESINLRYVDEVWVTPCGRRTDKQTATDLEHRLEMTKRLVSEFFPPHFPVKINEIEIKNGKSIPTYWLMRRFIEDPENKDYDFYFIFGSDLLKGIRKWEEGEKLVKEIKFIIFVRIGYPLNIETLPDQYIIVYSSFVASSSTQIRKRVAAVRNEGRIEIANPKLERRMSFEEETENIAAMKEINVSSEKLSTIPQESCISHNRKTLEEKYLAIYGIVPSTIIEYIKENDLFLFQEEK